MQEQIIGAKFYHGKKEYYWKNKKNWHINVGDFLMVQSRDTMSIVRVSSVNPKGVEAKNITKEVIENLTETESLWTYAIGMMNYIGVPMTKDISLYQNLKTGHFAYQYKDGDIKSMTMEQSLTFDAIGWLNDVLFGRVYGG